MPPVKKKTAASNPRTGDLPPARRRTKLPSPEAQKLKDVLRVGAAVLSKRVKIVGNGGDPANLGAELAELFRRHGITVRDVEVSEVSNPIAMPGAVTSFANSLTPFGYDFSSSASVGVGVGSAEQVKEREIPSGMNCLDAALDCLGASAALIEERLEKAGVLAPQTAGTDGDKGGRIEPETAIAKRLFGFEGRVLSIRGALLSLAHRLEA